MKVNDLDLNKQTKHDKRIKVLLMVLFVLTLLSLWGGFLVVFGLMQFNNAPADLMINYMWGFLLCLPIPIMSIILGLKHKKQGIKCKKNIVGGCIVGALLIVFGLTSFSFHFKINYNEISSYNQIIGVDIPKEGKFYRMEWDSSYLLEHVSDYVIFTNKSESGEFYKNIKSNENWILKDDINTNLNNFVPVTLLCESKKNKCYYSIYIKELNDYNKVPEKTGKYHVNTMMYDPDKSCLMIEEFVYSYKS